MSRATVAASFVVAAEADGLRPPADLALLAEPVDRGAAVPVCGPGDLGPLHERGADDAERARRGAWYTPAWLAADLVERALPDRAAVDFGPVLDPTCGGGVFLLAAAERLVALGIDPAGAVARLRGCEVDGTATAVAEAALWWWGARQGVETRPDLRVVDALLAPAVRAGAVVGNPPFLGQLRSATVVDAARRAALHDRFGDAVRAYTDPAWLFALAAVEQVAPGGRVALLQPQSFLAARDAAAVRARIDASADLIHLVVDDGSAFEANVQVCAPVLRRRAAASTPRANDWVGALADVKGIPAPPLRSERVLGDLATVHAGFRDEYYGMVDAVSEAGERTTGLRLVTAGGIDPCRLLTRGERFAGRRWDVPVIDTARLAGRAARWAEVQAGPKVLVATQTKVIEAVADPDGTLLGSVPVLCVRPRDPGRLWHVLAALHAPSATAWLLRRSAGTALSADAIRPTAALLTGLPVPADGPAWDRAAAAARAVRAGAGDVAELGRLADAALGVDDPDVLAWWDARRPRR